MSSLNRRQLLQTALGGTVTVALAGVHRACLADADFDAEIRHPFMTRAQRDAVAAIAELIIPKTDTPGAIEAGVPGFIELMLSDWYKADERQPVIDGLAELDRHCVERWDSGFLECTSDRQAAALTGLEDREFFSTLKALTVYGYYTSKVGAGAELIFEPAPGRYTTIDFADVGKQWVT